MVIVGPGATVVVEATATILGATVVVEATATVATDDEALLAMVSFLDAVLAEYLPCAFRTSFTVHVPEALVVTFPLFKRQEPDTDQIFAPVELVEAIVEVA